jgi:hypothetical protein
MAVPWRQARSPVLQAIAFARVSPDRLRRQSEGAQEGAAHAIAIGKTRLPAMTSIGWRLCSIISLAASTRRFSTALAGDWPVSARNARLNWHVGPALKCGPGPPIQYQASPTGWRMTWQASQKRPVPQEMSLDALALCREPQRRGGS